MHVFFSCPFVFSEKRDVIVISSRDRQDVVVFVEFGYNVTSLVVISRDRLS